MAAALATSWMLGGGAGARAQVTSEPSAVVFPDPTKFAHGLYTEGEFGVVAFIGPRRRRRRARVRDRRARRLRHLLASSRCSCTCWARPTRSQGDTPHRRPAAADVPGDGRGEADVALRCRWSFFAEGGLGAARMSTQPAATRWASRALPHRLHRGRRRRHRLPLAVAPLLDRPARRLLLAAATSAAAGT